MRKPESPLYCPVYPEKLNGNIDLRDLYGKSDLADILRSYATSFIRPGGNLGIGIVLMYTGLAESNSLKTAAAGIFIGIALTRITNLFRSD